jgi:hypothetical protein
MAAEPRPCGIPNSVGTTCWFQSCTQCIFRRPDIREAILSFTPEAVQIRPDENSLAAFHELISHFTNLKTSSPSICNTALLRELRDRFNKPLVDDPSAHGRDAYCALEAYFALFATLLGSSTYDLHSFNPPMGGFQSVRLS